MSESNGAQDTPAPAIEPSISTVAGTGSAGYSGDGQSATKAGLHDPSGLAMDTSGNLYIADPLNNRVRKVDARTQTITTVAGNGNGGFSGDEGPATKAGINAPRDVAVDSDGNLYIADTLNHRIRKVDARTQTITTVAGDGDVFFSGDGGPATKASISGPYGVAVDSGGNLYIADTDNNRVRKVDAGSQTIRTVAGDGDVFFSGDEGPATKASINSPHSVAVDSDGHLYIADTDHNRVRRVDAHSQVITTVAGNGTGEFSGDGGPAIKAGINGPYAVTVDPSGNLYIADSGGNNHRVRRVDARTRTITTVAGNGDWHFSGDGGPAVKAGLDPRGLAVDSLGSVYIADTDNHRVRKVSGSSAPVEYSVSPGVPPEVTLTRGGAPRYPGVRLHTDETGAIRPQNVHVTLPLGKGLQFVPESGPDYQLTVMDAHGTLKHYNGTLSSDGQSLTFEDVALALSGRGSESRAWVAVKAAANAPLGDTSLSFHVGDRHSPSTPIHVGAQFSASPGVPPSQVTVTRAGEHAYTGVLLRANEQGTVLPQNVQVTLPPGKGLQFVEEGDPGYQLTVQNLRETKQYNGVLSPDKQAITFEGVDLALTGPGSESRAWVSIKASPDAPLGDTSLGFQVGDRSSRSAPVRVVAAKAG
ncbi:NHL repeat-containing protein [Streptomyces sp. NPDC021096]|uniref:NHL repeat-containing protein n=1 Tax=Streptomyces sp. NPDC021096 TaxID=3154792 RepID=UPI0033FCDAB4